MAVKTIDAKLLQKMFLAGAASIDAKKDYINELNVFPVPDGDTGTNMTMTIMSAASEVSKIEKPDMVLLCKAISSGSLRGARGNSGVILSQLFRGFTKEVKECQTIDINKLVLAFNRAVDTAYKAVMKPKEGTILTVAKGGAWKAAQIADKYDNIEDFVKEVIDHMEKVLEQTPDLLPVLKEAGVVDSGGQGLLEIVKGAYNALIGKEIKFESDGSVNTGKKTASNVKNDADADIKFGYCTEFIIMAQKKFTQKDENNFKGYLETIGDCIVVVADDEIVKVHVHTNNPGLAIEKALTYGALTSMKIDNMREEHHEKLIKDAENAAKKNADKEVVKRNEPRKKVGFVSVSIGDGLNEIFRELGADYIIEGGQTMNPSTEDVLNAISQVNADTVFILPNNGNIILAAQQAKDLTKDKAVIVVPTKTVPEGITAIINYVGDRSPKENLETMTKEIANVKTGQVTYAVRNTVMDGVEIKENDIMGLDGKNILSVGNSIEDVTVELVGKLVDDDSELVSVYFGEDVDEDAAAKLSEKISKNHPDVDVEVNYGGQPIYYYLLSVE